MAKRIPLRPPPLLLQPFRGKRLHRLRTQYPVPLLIAFILLFSYDKRLCPRFIICYVSFLRHPQILSNAVNARIRARASALREASHNRDAT